MRYESSVTSVSWIPSEAMTGPLRVPVDIGIGHYDAPLPADIDDLEALRVADRFRFANELRAWIEVDDGRVVDAGYSAGGHMGSTTLAIGLGSITIPAVSFPDLRAEPIITATTATFRQTTGGRTGAPLPRRNQSAAVPQDRLPNRVDHAQFDVARRWIARLRRHRCVQDAQTLDLQPTERSRGQEWNDRLQGLDSGELWGQHAVGRCRFPGHRDCSRDSARAATLGPDHENRQETEGPEARPAGDSHEAGRSRSRAVPPPRRSLSVEVGGGEVAEVGPGSILGERALIEGGIRTSTLRATTPVTVAVAAAPDIQTSVLEQLALVHQSEAAGS